jgi:hypothetical protein
MRGLEKKFGNCCAMAIAWILAGTEKYNSALLIMSLQNMRQ